MSTMVICSCAVSHVISSSFHNSLVQIFLFDIETFYFEICTFCDFQMSDPNLISKRPSLFYILAKQPYTTKTFMHANNFQRFH